MSDDEEVIVQDNARELLLAELLHLRPTRKRLGHDAEDEVGNKYELKTTTKSGFGTGRDVSPQMISEWRTRYWVCARGRNLKSGFVFDEVYFLSPNMLEGWFGTLEGRFKPDTELRDAALEAMAGRSTRQQLDRIRYLFDRGMTYNNPHIGLVYVKGRGVLLDRVEPDRHLRRLVAEHALRHSS